MLLKNALSFFCQSVLQTLEIVQIACSMIYIEWSLIAGTLMKEQYWEM
jgi:hypothetical protein